MADTAAPPDPAVVDLVDAGVPADQGLVGLGLIMQLGGNLFAGFASLVLVIVLFAARSQSSEWLWGTCIVMSSIVRSIAHANAGKQLVYGRPDQAAGGRLDAARRYTVFGILHALGVGALAKFVLDAPGELALGLTLALALWPVALFALLRLPRFARFEQLPLTEDKGFEGASILMTLFGACGVLVGGVMLLVVFRLPGRVLQHGPNMLLVLALVMLFIRSLLHLHAGMSGLKTTSLDRSVELTSRYANFGVISAFAAAGALLVVAMTSEPSVPGLGLICIVCWLLLAWPLILRRFFADRQFSDLLAGNEAPVHRRAPDAGLTWLGWFLIAHAAMQGSLLVMTLFAGHAMRSQELFALVGASATRSLWWSVGLYLLQAWAGYELVRMSPHSKVVATAYAAVAAAIVAYVNWPMIEAMSSMRHFGDDLFEMPVQLVQFGMIGVSLIIPVATFVLVRRHIAPAARARYTTPSR